jgi:hypothetical protein
MPATRWSCSGPASEEPPNFITSSGERLSQSRAPGGEVGRELGSPESAGDRDPERTVLGVLSSELCRVGFAVSMASARELEMEDMAGGRKLRAKGEQ